MTHFITEFGHRIDFVPGYYDAHRNFTDYIGSTGLHEGLTKVKKALPLGASLKDWVTFSSIHQFMHRYGLSRKKRQRGIDLGGAEGTHIRFLKAAGIIEYAVNSDIDDYSDVAGDTYFRDLVETIARLKSQQSDETNQLRKAVTYYKSAFDHASSGDFPSGMVFDFPNTTDIDENLHCDVFDIKGKYNFVTTSFCFDYFDLNRALPKVRELLTDNGLFVGLAEYWWWPTNSVGVIGDFPYASTRLSYADLERYCREFRPELLPNVHTKYNYFHQGKQHPTIDDWASIGRKHGLKLVAVERVIPQTHHRLKVCPPLMFWQPWFEISEVLRDIHYLHPGVTTEDLMTSAIRIAFVPA